MPWRGEELFARPDWHVTLSSAERDELAVAARAVSDRPLEELEAEDAALALLAPRLERVRHDLEHGSGASLVRALEPVDDEDLLARAFWLLALHLGTPLSQSADGARLLHVRDEGFAPGDPRFRGPHSSRRLSFHTDRCDAIAFLCVRPAHSGGENHVLSSEALRDALRARHPAHAATLERDALPYLRHTIDPGNAQPYTRVPVFTEHEGRFAASLLRVLVDRADASPDAPNLTVDQRAALDALEEVAEDPALYASFRLESGDVLLLNNWTTFHRRTAFEDDPDPARRRHLLRIWLSTPNSRALDPRFSGHFGATAAGALRGGLRRLDS